MSVSNDFSALVSNLQIDNQSTISTRYRAITKRLNNDFWDTVSETSHSWYVGSVGRGTAIKGVSDIDMIMQLPGKLYETYNNYTSNGQSALLQEVKNSIKKTYSTTDLGGDGQVVVVNFVDMKFEVVPCFSTVEGDFIYPDSNNGGSWKRMNPLAEITAIRNADNDYNNNVRRLAKMMRAWKEKCNVPIPGMLLDTLIQKFMPNWSYNDKSFSYYDYMTRDFLKYLSEQNQQQSYWIAPGSGRRVERKGVFENKAMTSYNDAVKAIEYQDKEMSYSATQEWKKIFGSYFPS